MKNVPAVVEKYMAKVNEKIGTNYQLFNYYGAADAEHVIVAMGSVLDTIEETIDYLNANGGNTALSKFVCTVRSAQTNWLLLFRRQ